MNERTINKETKEIELQLKQTQLRNELNIEKRLTLDKLTELRLAISEVTLDEEKEQVLGSEPILKRVFTPSEIVKLKARYFKLLNEL